MILPALLLLAQDAMAGAAAPVEGVQEIVVTAKYGHTTLLFDKGSDGKLHNCRIMVSSGSAKRDRNACEATPVCYAGTVDKVTDCVPFARIEAADLAPAPPAPGGSQTFAIPKLVLPPTKPSPTLIGPVGLTSAARDTDRQRVTLPPLPKPSSDGSAIRITAGQPEDSRGTDSQILPGRAD